MYSDERTYKLEMGIMLLQEPSDIPDLEDDEGVYAGYCTVCGELYETPGPDPLDQPIICVQCCEERGDT